MKYFFKKNNIKSFYYFVHTLWILSMLFALVPLADLAGAIFNQSDSELDYLPVEVTEQHLSLPNVAEIANFRLSNLSAEVTFPVDRIVVFYEHGLKLGLALIVVAVFYFARQLVKSLRTDSTPFTLTNVKRLRILILLIVGGFLLKYLAYFGLSFMINNQLAKYSLAVDVSSAHHPSNFILITIILVILEEVFRYGVKMQEEQTLTI